MNFKEYLLLAEMPMQETPPDQVLIRLQDDDGRDIIACLVDADGSDREHDPRGLVCAEYHQNMDCFEIKDSTATNGWGPLLYEVVMEAATRRGKGLMSDRHAVSPAAGDVWKRFFQRTDVVHQPIPAYRYQIDEDPTNPLYYSFRKAPAIRIATLQRQGKLMTKLPAWK